MTATRRRKTLSDALAAPVDAASVAVFRVAFGLLMLVLVVRFFLHGWIAEYFLAPKVFFSYYGFEWVRPWPGVGMYLHFAAMGVLGVFVALGAFYRVSVALFGLLFAYAHLIDKTNYLNHYYLLICLSFLMMLLPLHRFWSVDAWRKPMLRSSTVPAWALWALRAQIGLVYLFGGIAKLKSDWIVEARPMKIWLAANTDFPVLGRFFGEAWVAHGLSYAGAAFDLSIVPLLLLPRTRPLAYGAVVVFHLMTAKLFQLGMFPWIMMASSLLFLPPSWPRRPAERFNWRLGWPLGWQAAAPIPGLGGSTLVGRPSPLVVGVLAVYFVFHLLMPLGHFLYPGNVCWTEQGFRFSWNVMLMEKNGSVDFRVTEPATGKAWAAVSTDYLTRYQAKMMASQPDMILAFAHSVARDFRTRGIREPEVRVDAFASLNGRRQARLIDPSIDLALEEDSLASKPWILPLPQDEDRNLARMTLDRGR